MDEKGKWRGICINDVTAGQSKRGRKWWGWMNMAQNWIFGVSKSPKSRLSIHQFSLFIPLITCPSPSCPVSSSHHLSHTLSSRLAFTSLSPSNLAQCSTSAGRRLKSPPFLQGAAVLFSGGEPSKRALWAPSAPPAVPGGRPHIGGSPPPSVLPPPCPGSAGSCAAQEWRMHPTGNRNKQTLVSQEMYFACVWGFLYSRCGPSLLYGYR